MNDNIGVDRRVASWIDDQFPEREPAGLLDRVLDETNQRRPRPSWLGRVAGHHLTSTTSLPGVLRHRKEHPMKGNLRLVLGLGAIAVAAAVGLSLFASRAIPDVGGPRATSSPSLAPSPTSPAAARIGPLEAGAYVTVDFEPGLKFVVPAGWNVLGDGPSTFVLQGPDDGQPGASCPDATPSSGDACVVHHNIITVTAKRAVGSNAEDCEGLAIADSPTSVAGMIEVLSTDPRFVMSAPSEVTFGAFSGQTFDIRLAETWTGTCKWSAGAPAAIVLTAVEPPASFEGVMGPEQLGVFLLDSEDGVVSITIDPYFRTEAHAVVDTFEFGR
jgi:hypothetical protein